MKEMRLFLTALFVLFSVSLSAQNITVKGTVTDDRTGEPIPYTSVQVKGTTIGASTDDLGNYAVSTPSNGVLVFVFIGYQTLEVPVNGRKVLNVTLKEDVQNLEGVVVTALGITKKEKTLGYAASKVSSDELTQGRASNVVSGLQGKIAGVKVTSSGATGSSQKV
ncbi:MAG: carboxypeptidase-like regulatory domain-containing protein, partial [Bacteroidales bacterium]|nr:carboxypeptidase-like regulatory domain-containing protein [Bacteroidales bacterium]